MNTLPNEILHKIFIRVPFKQRLECMLVYRRWYNILRNRSLLYDVEIKGEKMYSKFKNMVQHLLNRGDQVEIIDLEINYIAEFDYQEFFDMLPNLRELNYGSYDRSVKSMLLADRPPENVNTKLEIIRERVGYGLTWSLIKYNTCTRLRSLELEFNYVGILGETLFPCLKNTPALEELTLSHPKVGIDDCEILHKNVPTLKHLGLKHIFLNNGEVPSDILPATSVESLSSHIYHANNHRNHPTWYQYMGKKYTNLIDFDYDDQYISEADPHQVMTIYRDCILPIYNRIGNRLDTFKAYCIPNELDIINTLSEFGHRYESFYLKYNDTDPIFTQLAESDFSMYTKQLVLDFTIIPSPIMLQNFTSLKTLKIDMYNDNGLWDANLTDYLNGFPPTLTSFSAHFNEVKIEGLLTHSNNIKELYIHCDTVSPKLAEAVSTNFPKLKNLDLRGQVTESINITLPDKHLKKLSIAAYLERGPTNGFSIITAKNPQPQYYIGEKQKGRSDDFDTVPATAQDLQDRVNINITCASAEETYFSILPIISWMFL